MEWTVAAIVFLSVLAASLAGTELIRRYLESRNIVDQPNARSSHAEATPRGGGIAIVGVLLPALFLIGLLVLKMPAFDLAAFLLPVLLLALVSWRDDMGGLPALPRLATHVAAVAAGLATLPMAYFDARTGLPTWLVYGAAGIIWVWFINLFNFMDGIDGIAGVEAASIGIGVFCVGLLASAFSGIGLVGLAVGAAALGFLWWNWQPARIFLGDVGSVPLGYLLGWLLLQIGATSLWPVALILPLYYLADATITLIRRVFRGERVWQAHREHFYQRAVQRGHTHAQVVRLVLGTNILLVGLALAATLTEPWLPLAGAVAVVGALLWRLSGAASAAEKTR